MGILKLGRRYEEFEQLCYLPRRPAWFSAEHMSNPYRLLLESWLVEAIFAPGNPGSEHTPRVECVSQTIIHVNPLNPSGDFKVLIFGQPYYQKKTARTILNLVNYHRQGKE
ncbi:PREDICTED: KHDC3-like protein-like [Elephantulus edwardii]|uniref:KHDC3-like protein-like n=1 Tax=Elephantulus edwardii TaxID=28737 RepID=UPI0003F0E9DA|nr:PREDICTED: KHDC3-like protein-like [Elephantulus edwardii]